MIREYIEEASGASSNVTALIAVAVSVDTSNPKPVPRTTIAKMTYTSSGLLICENWNMDNATSKRPGTTSLRAPNLSDNAPAIGVRMAMTAELGNNIRPDFISEYRNTPCSRKGTRNVPPNNAIERTIVIRIQ